MRSSTQIILLGWLLLITEIFKVANSQFDTRPKNLFVKHYIVVEKIQQPKQIRLDFEVFSKLRNKKLSRL